MLAVRSNGVGMALLGYVLKVVEFAATALGLAVGAHALAPGVVPALSWHTFGAAALIILTAYHVVEHGVEHASTRGVSR